MTGVVRNKRRRRLALPPHMRRTSLTGGNYGIGLLFPLLLFCAFLCFPTFSVHAQTGSQVQWSVFREENGLISDQTFSLLALDNEIWLGSARGISRYDGAWTNYYHLEGQSSPNAGRTAIENGAVVALAAGNAADTLWAGSTNGQVAFWNGTQWLAAVVLPSSVKTLLEIEGTLYIGTEDGLWSYVPAQNSLERVQDLESIAVNDIQAHDNDASVLWIATDDGLWQLVEGQLQQLAMPASISAHRITALLPDENALLWLGTEEGIFLYDIANEEWQQDQIPVVSSQGVPGPITILAEARDGSVWAGANGAGARKFVGYGLITIDMAHTSGGGLTTPFVLDITIDQDDSIWFATPVGLFRYQEQSWLTDFQDLEGIRPEINEINDLLVDQANHVWIATAGAGLRRKTPRRIGFDETVFTQSNSQLPNDAVLTLVEDNEGKIWAGTRGGLAFYNGNTWQTIANDARPPSQDITTLLADETVIWIGTSAGLARYDEKNGEFTIIEPLLDMVIEALTLDSEGRLWVGTDENGIWRQELSGVWGQDIYDDANPLSFPASGISANGLTHDPKIPGRIWAIVDGGGLVYWDGNGWFDGDTEQRLPDGLLYRLYTDEMSGSLWVGTEAGVARFDGQTWGTLNIEDGLQGTAIYAIAQDMHDHYWFGGPDGLTRYWPEQTPPWVRWINLDQFIDSAGEPALTRGELSEIELQYGDLQTSPNRMALFYRTIGNGAWQEVKNGKIRLQPTTLDDVTVEVVARDLAFNYSPPIAQTFAVIPPPRLVNIPLLGELEWGIGWMLLILTAMVTIGFGYVSYEIIQERRRSFDAVQRGYNPYVSGKPVRDVDMFFGRHDLMQRIVDTLHNNSIMLYGERRIGKTTLLYQLTELLRSTDDAEYWFLPVYVDLEGTEEDEFFHYLMEEIVHQSECNPEDGDPDQEDAETEKGALLIHTLDAQAYRDRDFSRDIRRVLHCLEEYGEVRHPGKHLRLILLMDEMDVLSAYDHVTQQQMRRIFMRDFSATLGAVVAGIQINKAWDRVESPWYNLFNEIQVEPFEYEDAVALLEEPVKSIYRYEPDAIEFIIEHSLGRPYRIQQLALQAVNYMLSDGRRTIMLTDVQAAYADVQSHVIDEDEIQGVTAARKRATDDNGQLVQENAATSATNDMPPSSSTIAEKAGADESTPSLSATPPAGKDIHS